MSTLANELEKVAAVRARLEELKVSDPELVLDTIEGQTDLLEIMAYLLGKLGDEEYLQTAIASRIADLLIRKEDSESRGERLRGVLLTCLEATGLKSVRLAEATLSLTSRAPAAVIVDEDAIPDTDEFWETSRKLKKSAINAAVKEGREVPGVQMGNGGTSLSVRRK